MTHVQSPFAIVPWEVFADERLGKRHLKVLGALLSYRARNTGPFFATREQIAERCGIAANHVSDITTELQRFGWLQKHGKGRAVTRYEFTTPDSEPETVPCEGPLTVPQEGPSQNVDRPEKTPQPSRPRDSTVPPTGHSDTRTDTRTEIKERVRAARFTPPTELEVIEYCRERANGVDPERWYAHYTSNGWRVGRNPMRDWRAAVRTWENNELRRDKPHENRSPSRKLSAVERVEAAIRERRQGEPEAGAAFFGTD